VDLYSVLRNHVTYQRRRLPADVNVAVDISGKRRPKGGLSASASPSGSSHRGFIKNAALMLLMAWPRFTLISIMSHFIVVGYSPLQR